MSTNRIPTLRALVRDEGGLCHPQTIAYERTDTGLTVYTSSAYPFDFRPTGETANIAGWGRLSGPATVYASDETIWQLLIPAGAGRATLLA